MTGARLTRARPRPEAEIVTLLSRQRPGFWKVACKALRGSGRVLIITVPELVADALGDFLANYMRQRYGSSQNQLVELVPSIARIALECIGNSDALYHNVEHTMLVTLAGHDILRGRAASSSHDCRRPRPHHHCLPDSRYRLCARSISGRRQGRLRRGRDRPQGGTAARIVRRRPAAMSTGRRCM